MSMAQHTTTIPRRQPPTIALPPSPPQSPGQVDWSRSTHSSDLSFKLQDTQSRYIPITPDRTPSCHSSVSASSLSSNHKDENMTIPNENQENETQENHDDQNQNQIQDDLQVASKKAEPKLEDFRLIRVLGKGSAGRVLLVKETFNSAIHAMKAVSKRSVLAHDELDHILTEIRVLKRFAIEEPGNPFITKLNYAFMDAENFYFVMDFYPGGDLATQLEIYGYLGHVRTRFYAADIVQGLEDVHRHGIVLRDLKPENILLNAQGHAVLADFGLAKEHGYRGTPHPIQVVTYPGQSDLPEWAGAGAGSLRVFKGVDRIVVDRSHSFVGTCEYVSPEMVHGRDHSYATDFWSLGCIVVECLIGRDDEPPVNLWNRIVNDDWYRIFDDPVMRGYGPERFDIDDRTWEFIDALLQKDPMWRLTEPHVKHHPYFADVDWKTVMNTGYKDPHGLYIDPLPESNTHYFPKLCLDQTPTVDLRGHDDRDRLGARSQVKTALNDNETYAWELARFKHELKEFCYTRSPSIEKKHTDLVKEELSEKGTTDLQYLADPESRSSPMLPQTESCSSETQGGGLTDNLDTKVKDEAGPSSASSLTTFLQSLRRSPEEPTPTSLPSSKILGAELQSPPVSPAASLTREPKSTSEPVRIPSPKPNQLKAKKLPPGLPAAGLSSSDIVAVPSPSSGQHNVLVRRHLPRSSVDSANTMARLSIELPTGAISHLGDEDWEELDVDDRRTPIPSLPNAAPSTFFTRGFGHVLRRRPSMLITSGLRRQVKTSQASTTTSGNTSEDGPSPGGYTSPSRDGSPTKSRQVSSRDRNGNRKVFGLGKFTVFPKTRGRGISKSKRVGLGDNISPFPGPNDDDATALDQGLDNTPSKQKSTISFEENVDQSNNNASPSRPKTTRRHTESTPRGETGLSPGIKGMRRSKSRWFEGKSFFGGMQRSTSAAEPEGNLENQEDLIEKGMGSGSISVPALSAIAKSPKKSTMRSVSTQPTLAAQQSTKQGNHHSSPNKQSPPIGTQFQHAVFTTPDKSKVGAPRLELTKTPEVDWRLDPFYSNSGAKEE